ncbi:PREDICTED: uncharacterized protein LOC108757446 isoform X1 [Trachymyrmex cornetzi]|uniref:uncharacterized protein LOC108757446 isoform X1 n=1 Tax=Trachymyrmex cornetzi TaxID=471704 RepID=UPI00084F5361|nr:PREDICTED: uncharacterized protein LOC108757446 isoform X1 [Trachymyrmex cornetzi]
MDYYAFQEPDVIVNTKNNGKSIEDIAIPDVPVAPLHRKKKIKTNTPDDLAVKFISYLFIALCRSTCFPVAASKSSKYYRIDYERIRALLIFDLRQKANTLLGRVSFRISLGDRKSGDSS